MNISNLSSAEIYRLDSIAFHLGFLRDNESLEGKFKNSLPEELDNVIKLSRLFFNSERDLVLSTLDRIIYEFLNVNKSVNKEKEICNEIVSKIKEAYLDLVDKQGKGEDSKLNYFHFEEVLEKHFCLR